MQANIWLCMHSKMFHQGACSQAELRAQTWYCLRKSSLAAGWSRKLCISCNHRMPTATLFNLQVFAWMHNMPSYTEVFRSRITTVALTLFLVCQHDAQNIVRAEGSAAKPSAAVSKEDLVKLEEENTSLRAISKYLMQERQVCVSCLVIYGIHLIFSSNVLWRTT